MIQKFHSGTVSGEETFWEESRFKCKPRIGEYKQSKTYKEYDGIFKSFKVTNRIGETIRYECSIEVKCTMEEAEKLENIFR